MNSFMRCVSRTARCASLYRGEKLEKLGLNGCHHTYILAICRTPGISQEQLSRTIYINKSLNKFFYFSLIMFNLFFG